MANEQQLLLLKQGVEVWNNWRVQYKGKVDLSGAGLYWINLAGANLSGADLSGAYLTSANLKKADLSKVDLSGANLVNAKLDGANLCGANLEKSFLTGASFISAKLIEADLTQAHLVGAFFSNANLCEADLTGANLYGAYFFDANLKKASLFAATLSRTNFNRADLSEADLRSAVLVETILEQATLTNCKIYGLSAWNLKGIPKEQSGLIITPKNESAITVDDMQVAQFIYLLLNRENIRKVLNSVTSKAVLILGRFTAGRKVILNRIAEELRKFNLLPIIFDFERPTSRDFTETIKTLAGISLFVIADITNPKSSSLELQAVVPDYEIPFVPIIQDGEESFSMFSDLGKYDWMLKPVISYSSADNIAYGFKEVIIDRAWNKRQELQARKAETIKAESIDEYMSRNKKVFN
jgi:uncharacterized protein YjbI with pentapeptide repeats